VKTDRRDAQKLAQHYREGQLTEIRVPTDEEEAARDLVRAREDAVIDRLRARHRLGKFLLRHGRLYAGKQAWSQTHYAWLHQQRFDVALAQQTFDAYLAGVAEADDRLASLTTQVLDLGQRPSYAVLVQALRSWQIAHNVPGTTTA
jgi:transposase